MTHDQLKWLKEIYLLLLDVQMDDRKLYPMTVIDQQGRREYLANREEYLEHIVDVTLDELAETFPQIEE